MGMPERTISSPALCFSMRMLMGMMRVLIAWSMQVLVLMPHLSMAMPVSMVLPQHQSNTSNHQDAGCDQVDAGCLLP